MRPTMMGHSTRARLHRRGSHGSEHCGARDTVTVVLQLTRRQVHRLVLVAVVRPDGRSSLCEKTRVKGRVIEVDHRRRGPPVITLVRRRGRLLFYVVGMLSRMMVMVAVHRNRGYAAVFSFSFSIYLPKVLSCSLLFPSSHLPYSDACLQSFLHDT